MGFRRKNFDKIVAAFSKPIKELEQYINEQIGDAGLIYDEIIQKDEQIREMHEAKEHLARQRDAALDNAERAQAFKVKLEAFLN